MGRVGENIKIVIVSSGSLSMIDMLCNIRCANSLLCCVVLCCAVSSNLAYLLCYPAFVFVHIYLWGKANVCGIIHADCGVSFCACCLRRIVSELIKRAGGFVMFLPSRENRIVRF